MTSVTQIPSGKIVYDKILRNCQQKTNLIDFNFSNPSTQSIQHFCCPRFTFDLITLMQMLSQYG